MKDPQTYSLVEAIQKIKGLEALKESESLSKSAVSMKSLKNNGLEEESIPNTNSFIENLKEDNLTNANANANEYQGSLQSLKNNINIYNYLKKGIH